MPQGCGRLTVEGDKVTDQYSHFPLRLQSIRLPSFDGAIVYGLGYGGGLVHGDGTHLQVTLTPKARSMYLTRGGLKVFGPKSSETEETRRTACTHCETQVAAHIARELSLLPGASAFLRENTTTQMLHYHVDQQSCLIHLPDATTCYAGARFQSYTSLDLQADGTSSCLYLDWYTSGRPEHDEHWSADAWRSVLTVRLLSTTDQPRLYLREAWDGRHTSSVLHQTFGAYATLFVTGPETLSLQHHLLQVYQETVYHARHSADAPVWSCFTMDRFGVKSLLVKIATREHFQLKAWLYQHLRGNFPDVSIAFCR